MTPDPQENYASEPFAVVASHQAVARPVLSADQRDILQNTLSVFSDSSFMDPVWDVNFYTSGESGRIRFPACEETDAHILRAAALVYATQFANAKSPQRIVREGYYFLNFLAQKGLHIESIRNPVVQSYYKHLESLTMSSMQRNSRFRAAGVLCTTCYEYGLYGDNPPILDFSRSFSDYRASIRRAPDRCVMDALDRLFLNPATAEIPLPFRCCYYLLRLVPNRISEVLAMDLKCINYPATGVFEISIPTSKESPLHVPIYKRFCFSITGKLESILYDMIRTQQERVKEAANDSALDTDYLFYDPDIGRVITPNDFNAFLGKIISKHEIRDSSGKRAIVTSHLLRHVIIGENLRSGIISPEQAKKDAGHKNTRITFSYGYESEGDEAERLGKAVEAVFPREFPAASMKEQEFVKPRDLNKAKYKRLSELTPFCRIIPGYGLCTNAKCHPQYQLCIDCPKFTPCDIYLPYFEAAHKRIEARLLEFEKRGATAEAIQFELDERAIVEKYLSAMRGKQSPRSLYSGQVIELNPNERRAASV